LNSGLFQKVLVYCDKQIVIALAFFLPFLHNKIMRKVLVVILIFLGVVLAVEAGFLLFVKNQKNTASLNSCSFPHACAC
ncbi:MAG: hypothetical protein N2559_14595, partial [Anaerolineae bacterium]|nr:hypothetical protein [Anaerolineae bacterium]